MSRSPLQANTSSTRQRPVLTAVIVNYNSWSDVRRLVGNLAQTPEVAAGWCAVVVVDNASQNPPPQELVRPDSRVRVVVRPENGGFAAGVNTGWRASQSDWLLVLNPDVVVPDGQLGAIVAKVERYENAGTAAPGIVGFGLRNPDGSRQPSVGAFPSLARTVWEQLIPRSRRKYQPAWRARSGPVPWVTGACVLMNTGMLAAVGGMDEDFFLYHEEVALCHSAHQLGWRVEFEPAIEVVHLHPLQNRAISPKMRVITRHSKLLYFRKHLPPKQFVALTYMVAGEAAIRGVLSRFQGRNEDIRAWRTIAGLARAFRAGVEPRGRDVLTLAETVTVPAAAAEPDGSTMPPAIASARMRRGAADGSLLQPRKDGEACR